MKLWLVYVIPSYELHSKNVKRNHDTLSVNGFLVEINESFEFTSRLILGCQKQGSKKKGAFLSYTKKKLGFREVK